MAFPIQTNLKYTIVGADGTTAVLNDQTDPNFVGMLDGEDAVTGLEGVEVRENADELTEGDGGVHGSFYRGRRPVTFKGLIMPITSATDRNTKGQRLLRAFGSNFRGRYPLDTSNGNATIKWTPDGAPDGMQITARTQVPPRTPGGWAKQFFVGVVAADPRIYGQTARTATLLSTANPNVQPNGDFEVNATGWAGFGTGGGTPSAVSRVSDAGAGSGSFAGEISNATATGAGVLLFYPPSVTGATDVVAGQTVNFSGSVKAQAGTFSSIKLSTRWYSAAGTLLAGGEVDVTGAVKTSPVVGTWYSISGSQVAPTNAAYARVEVIGSFGGAGSYTMRVDNLVASPVPVPGTTYDRSMAVNSAWGTQVAQGAVTNLGDGVAPLVIQLWGPGTNFAIQNATTGEELAFSQTLNAGVYLEVDTLAGTITMVDGAGVRTPAGGSLSVARSRWWGLIPGANDIRLLVNAGTTIGTTKAVLNHRYVWI